MTGKRHFCNSNGDTAALSNDITYPTNVDRNTSEVVVYPVFQTSILVTFIVRYDHARPALLIYYSSNRWLFYYDRLLY